jgi:putative ABC transport system permease protein
MNILKIIQVALKALNRNKMRTFLTMLGIIVGVVAVIAMISIGQGANASIQNDISSLGTNLLFVRSGSSFRGGIHYGSGSVTSLSADDAEAIVNECPSVSMASPTISTRAQVKYQNKNWNTSINGVGVDYLKIRNWELEAGSFFQKSNIGSAAKLCVIGKTVLEELFDSENPIGQIIRIRGIPFTVIGVLREKGESGGWMDQDDIIMVPYTSVQKRLMEIDYISSIDVSAIDSNSMDKAEEEIRTSLRNRHKLSTYEEDDFNIRSMADISQFATETTETMTLLLGSIASVSLIVGGIGIMNIMLVSVTERIREIGVRMAVGARESDILKQFLIESIVLSVTGGLVGIVLGIIGSKAISTFAGWTTLISPGSILLAFAFSAVVGIFFGFYPATKASKLNPIEALRYE